MVHDWRLLNNIEKAALATINLMKEGKKVWIQADADCDGMMSGAILYIYLKKIFPESDISWRVHDVKMHGVIVDTVPNETDIVFIPDAGSNQYEEHKLLTDMGKTVIVLDHHLCEKESKDAIVVNNQLSSYPNKNFSGIETMKLIQLNGLEEAVTESKKIKIENEKMVRKNIIKEIDETKQQLEAVKKLIIKIAIGESKLSEEYVEEQIKYKEEELKEYQRKLNESNEKIAELENENKKTIKIKSELCNWEEKYRNADWDSKKTMLSRVLDSVEYSDVIKININIIINELLKQST